MRIVFFGTPEFALSSLQMLVEKGYNVVGVITQKDKKSGRGNKARYSPVKQYAVKNNLKLFQPEKISSSEFIKVYEELNIDIAVTAAYGQILSKKILEIPSFGTINIHASLLPKYRGAAPINRAVINGETRTGITTMLTNEGIDTGDMLLQEEVEIKRDMTAGELHDILMVKGAEVLDKTLMKIKDKTIKRIPQDNTKATYAKKISRDTGRIDFNMEPVLVHNLVRGTNPYPGAFSYMNKKRMKIFKTALPERKEMPCNKMPGTIIDISDGAMKVCAGSGYIYIKEIQFENQKRMDISVCGHNIRKGTVLSPEI